MSKVGAGQNINVDVDSGYTTKYIIYGIVGVAVLSIAYFGIIRPALQAINLIDTKEERQGQKDLSKLSRKQVLSPSLYKENRSKVTITSGQAHTKAVDIYKGKGIIYDDETLAVGAITSAGSLVNISYISYVFNSLYNRSMESYMKSYLELEDWTDIDNYIDKTNKF